MSTAVESAAEETMPESTMNVGEVVDGKYLIERELGTGGMGRVLLATHLGLDERVAIKVLLRSAMEVPEAVTRFAQEAKAAARIKSEHVSRVLDVAKLADGTPYIVMEYLEGSDLEQLVSSRGVLAMEDAVDYVLQACEAIAEAHARGVIHRDLKPGNLHLSSRSDGTPMVKVLDFGISKIQTPGGLKATSTSALFGSPLYMSPEQMAASTNVDGRADIWALGVVLYELISGHSPFEAESMPQVCTRVLHTDPDPLNAKNVPAALRAVIMKCLEKKRENRYSDVAEFAEALAPFAPERSRISIDRMCRARGGPPSGPFLEDAARKIQTVDIASMTHDAHDSLGARKPLFRLRPSTVRSISAGAALVIGVVLSGYWVSQSSVHHTRVAELDTPASPAPMRTVQASPVAVSTLTSAVIAPTDLAPATESPTPTVRTASSVAESARASASASHAHKHVKDLTKQFGGRE